MLANLEIDAAWTASALLTVTSKGRVKVGMLC